MADSPTNVELVMFAATNIVKESTFLGDFQECKIKHECVKSFDKILNAVGPVFHN